MGRGKKKTQAQLEAVRRQLTQGGGGGGGASRGRGDDPAAARIEMSVKAEERVRRALERIELTTPSAGRDDDDTAQGVNPRSKMGEEGGGATGPSSIDPSVLSEGSLRRLYDDLVAEGFVVADVEASLTAVVAAHCRALPRWLRDEDGVSMMAALDWLCFHLPNDRLPRRYQGGVRVAAASPGSEAAAVKVVHAATTATTAATAAAAEKEEERAAKDAAARTARAVAEASAAAAAKAKEEEEEAAARRNREMIMRQYEEGSDGDEESSDHDSLEDFGLDPKEVERRARLRRRRRAFDADAAAHIAVMRRERDDARAEAAAGKATRDKARQRAASDAIRAIMDECAAYGITEEDLLPPPPPPVPEADAEAGGDGWENEAEMSAQGEKEGGLPLDDDVDGEANEEEKKKSNATAAPEADEEDDDEGGFGLDLFDVEAETAELLGVGASNDPYEFTLEEAPLFPPSTIPAPSLVAGGKKKGGKKGGANPAAVNKVEPVMPKALLQMLCRRENWLAPRYDRSVPGTGAAAAGAVVQGVSYSVTVERTGGGKHVRGGSAAKAAALGTITCTSPEEDAPPGGWPTVNDAQNAAAAKALFLAVGMGGAFQGRGSRPSGSNVALGPMPSELPSEYRAAWRRWAREAFDAAAMTGASVTDGMVNARDAFIRGLLRNNTDTADDDKAKGGDEPKDSWDQDSGDEGEGEDVANGRPAGKDGDIGGSSEMRASQATAAAAAATSERLTREAAAKQSDPKWQKMFAFRQNLPVAALRSDLLRALAEGDTAVVCGETGSGKTTQVPQYLLDDAIARGQGAGCRVICTQPRRVAALTVAERVAAERCERGGVGGAGSVVGHHVRLDAAVTKDTRLTFMTAGILLRRMHGDPLLTGVSHVVLDEIHERSLDGDFLLALLRTLPAARRERGLPPLKLIVMSATLNAELFCGYLGGCPVVQAPGRTHPVTTVHLEDIHDMLAYALDEDSRTCRRPQGEGRNGGALDSLNRQERAMMLDSWGTDDVWRGDENPDYDAALYENNSALTNRNLSRMDEAVIDYDLIEALLARIDEETPAGAFLVFLPGIGEVSSLIDRLSAHPRFAPRHGKHRLVPLHSALSPAEQRDAFRVFPDGVRKIVVATNVAETSVTIEDVVVVIDSGRVKERQWDARRGMASLEEGWVSRAAARQRAGRAGRVRPGTCYALFTRHRATVLMRNQQVPEMHRVPLTEVVLQIKKLGVGTSAEAFLAGSLEPPASAAVSAALSTLREVGAIDATDDGHLTPLGHHLATLPVDCRVAKMLVYGALLSCLSPTLTIAACLSYKSPFLSGRAGGKATGGGAAAGDAARKALSLLGAGGIAAGEQSDHLTFAAAYEGWAKAVTTAEAAHGGKGAGRDVARRYAAKNGLCAETLKQIAEMRGQYAALLGDIGFINGVTSRRADSKPFGWVDDPAAAWNAAARHASVVKAVLTAGLYANVGAMETEGNLGARVTWRDAKGEVGIHPSSINSKLGTTGAGGAATSATTPAFPFIVFHEKVRTSRVFVRDCTVVAPAALLLFGGVIDVHHASGRVSLDGWLWLRASAQTAVLYKRLRWALDAELNARIRRAHHRDRKDRGGVAHAREGDEKEDLLGTIRSLLTEQASPQ